jgi:hypothetical protein
VRGKTGGAIRDVGSFQWTTAVKALAVLSLKTALAKARGLSAGHRLVGHKGSLAASLDYAVSKQPGWLTEMFGVDSLGISMLRRLVMRTNPERKRPGPVVLCFSNIAISNTSFYFTLNDSPVESVDGIQQLLQCVIGGLQGSESENEVQTPLTLAA